MKRKRPSTGDSRAFAALCSALLAAVSFGGCSSDGTVAPAPSAHEAATVAGVEQSAGVASTDGWATATGPAEWAPDLAGYRAEDLTVEVVSVRPHDARAFTQGLVWADGMFYESTGLYGQSTLRRVDPETGAVEQRTDLPADKFGEGLALIGDRLIQLTWRAHVAYEYDRSTFERRGEHSYDTEGWGLCFDGTHLVLSDGSPNLYYHDPDTFAPVSRVPVMLEGAPVASVNELECVGDDVYANVWQTDTIIRIDAATGRVEAVIDASGLLTPDEQVGADVLNGIARDALTGSFYITGKLWPKLFEVRFVPRPGAPG